MMNPLFQMLGQQALPPIVQQFMQFRQSFNGDARTQVQNLLNSGRISQADYNRAVQQAQQLQQMISRSGRV